MSEASGVTKYSNFGPVESRRQLGSDSETVEGKLVLITNTAGLDWYQNHQNR